MDKSNKDEASTKVKPKLSKPFKDYITDFGDINWVINHVGDLQQRLSVLRDLGYQLDTDPYIDKKTSFIKSAKIGNEGEIRLQVSRKLKNRSYVYCVVLR